MDYRKLKHTDLNVSRLCFGTMTFGKPADLSTATRMVDRCIDEGINFVDTANIYQAGMAEDMLGEAIRGKPIGAGTVSGLPLDRSLCGPRVAKLCAGYPLQGLTNFSTNSSFGCGGSGVFLSLGSL